MIDIRNFSILYLAELKVPIDALNNVMFLVNKYGVNMDYSFTLTQTGVRSKGLLVTLEQIESEGLISISDTLEITPYGKLVLYEGIIEKYTVDRLCRVLDFSTRMSSSILALLIVIILLVEGKDSEIYKNPILFRENLKIKLSNLTFIEYSDEKFNLAFKHLNLLKQASTKANT